jgi:oligoribonuclease NrnB/cAMP/cGMP phosphodiesterase (DHH superfamily)
MPKFFCIYHGNCADGFASAWIVRHVLSEENVDFHAGVYQDPPPKVSGRNVIMVDFSYKRPVLEQMAQSANAILILDHHKTAEEDLHDLPPPLPFREWRKNPAGCSALFDLTKSGAGLTWDYMCVGYRRPDLINHIEDRDLWRFALEGTREIQANVFSWPYDFEVWDRLMRTPVKNLRAEGEAIERKHFKDIDELIRVVTRRMKIGGYIVPVANLPYTLTSDAGHKLASNEPFAACYWDTPEGRVFSLRSRPDGVDVSEIAKQYGGGGHKNAAGFRVSFDQLEQFLP